jgi:L-cysteine/cystine lyase
MRTMAIDPRVAAVRRELPATESQVYLNTGTSGPLPRRTAEIIAAENERQLRDGRSNLKTSFDEYLPMQATVRARFARLLGAEVEEIALTHHTTEGMNIACWGLNWQPGDEIVTTSREHQGGLLPAYAVARRFGVTLRVVDLDRAGEDIAGAVTAAITPRTRLVVMSHVAFTSGAVLPVAAVAAAAHRVGAYVAVDGAQSCGAIPVDVRELDVDFYAVPGQKWLCGPEGVGALYVRRERISELLPTFVGFSSIRNPEAMDLSGYFMPAAGAARYELGTLYWPGLFGMNESLRWMEEDLGWSWMYEQTTEITQRCRSMLGGLPGVTIHTPVPHAGLTAFSVAGLDPQTTVTRLSERGITIRAVPIYNWFRVSTAFFNSDDDLDRLRDTLVDLRSAGG